MVSIDFRDRELGIVTQALRDEIASLRKVEGEQGKLGPAYLEQALATGRNREAVEEVLRKVEAAWGRSFDGV